MISGNSLLLLAISYYALLLDSFARKKIIVEMV
jgi:hypothetical protein